MENNNLVILELQIDKEYRILPKNGRPEFWVHGIGEVEFDQFGVPVKMIGTIQDITHQKLVNEALLQAKERAEASDRLKTAFLNNISHEVRTPLNGILGFGEMISESDLTPENKAFYLEILHKSSNRLLNTINDYMDISLIS
ncbi:MAG: PAS domain-containing sensor histidine kinase, partial [Bacteroidia bacterium]|nr:PAS domain-containing sensor histidine kinase [Bacteroidia bacterium]